MSLTEAYDVPGLCGKYISLIYRKSGERITRILKEIGLSSSQSILLIGIYRNQGVNQGYLGENLAIAPSVVSRTLRSLEDRNLIFKRVDEKNRRNFLLYLTPDGVAKAEESLLAQGRYWDEVLQDIDEDQIQIMNRVLQKLQDNVYSHTDA